MLYTPIKALDKFIKDWVIKVRLLRKYPPKDYKSRRKNKIGQLVNLEFVDKLGAKIQATMFTDEI